MDRGAQRATVHGVTDLDTTERLALSLPQRLLKPRPHKPFPETLLAQMSITLTAQQAPSLPTLGLNVDCAISPHIL